MSCTAYGTGCAVTRCGDLAALVIDWVVGLGGLWRVPRVKPRSKEAALVGEGTNVGRAAVGT